MLAALISVLVAIIASAGAMVLTKAKEREAAWRAKKLAHYEAFFGAASCIVGNTAPPDAKVRYATAVNNMHLIASAQVIKALHAFTDEMAQSNAANMTKERHDLLWSRLVWQIRADLGDPPGNAATFEARLWASWVGANVLPRPTPSGRGEASYDRLTAYGHFRAAPLPLRGKPL